MEAKDAVILLCVLANSEKAFHFPQMIKTYITGWRLKKIKNKKSYPVQLLFFMKHYILCF